MKTILMLAFIFILFAFSQQTALAQDADKTISIIVSGNGKTQIEAEKSALKVAIDQVFISFISSKIELLNKIPISDLISSAPIGSVKSFSKLNEIQLPDGGWRLVLKAVVSINKLTSCVEAKGIPIEISGNVFTLNIKQQLLNEDGEVRAVCDMVGLLYEQMQNSFDYAIKSGDPKSLDKESKEWEVPLEVTATTNKHIDFCANYCIEILSALSLSSDEKENYEKLNKEIFSVEVTYMKVSHVVYLRKIESYRALYSLLNSWEFAARKFTVDTSLGFYEGFNINPAKLLMPFDLGIGQFEHPVPIVIGMRINFLTEDQEAYKFSWPDKRSFADLSKMTGYKVTRNENIFKYEKGGFPFLVIPEHYIIGLELDETRHIKGFSPDINIAVKAGLRIRDEIVAVNDSAVNTGSDFTRLVNKSDNKDKKCFIKVLRKENVKVQDKSQWPLKVFNNIIKDMPYIIEINPVLEKQHTYIAAISDVGKFQPRDGTTKFEEGKKLTNLSLNGYKDWRLPTLEEMQILYQNLGKYYGGGLTDQNWYFAIDEKYSNSDSFIGLINGNVFNGHDLREQVIILPIRVE